MLTARETTVRACALMIAVAEERFADIDPLIDDLDLQTTGDIIGALATLAVRSFLPASRRGDPAALAHVVGVIREDMLERTLDGGGSDA